MDLLLRNKTAIRDAIVSKGQAVAAADPLSAYAAKIRAIQTGVDTSDATAAAGDILSGKTAYGAGGKLTGTIASRGASDLTASGATVSVPAGYYASSVSKSVGTAAQATPGISVSSAGLITASASQSAGYVSEGTKSATKQLTAQSGTTITPGTSRKTAVPSGRYTTGAVYVAGDTNLNAENIKKGVSIFGVTGGYNGPAPTMTSVTITNYLSYVVYVCYPSSIGNLTNITLEAEQSTTISVVRNSIFTILCDNQDFILTGGGYTPISYARECCKAVYFKPNATEGHIHVNA